MRLQFAGAVPLSKQEKFSKNMVQLQQDKAKLELELREVTCRFPHNENRLIVQGRISVLSDFVLLFPP